MFMKTPKYSVFTVFAVLDDFEMQSDAPYAGLPARAYLMLYSL